MSTSAPERSAGLEKYKEQRDVQLTKNLHEKLTAEAAEPASFKATEPFFK